ncbi:MAG: serine dehydratase subunit alpha family protein [Deltaproteobacteria bacterium]|nr:serine dehydratase subunit alpha family protein [Deltaproteobacteria bacterium]
MSPRVIKEALETKALALLKKNIIPALGCTEPAAVALACAKAREALGDEAVERVKVTLDRNLMRNALGVIIPGTSERGVGVAAALGALACSSSKGLMVFEGVRASDIEKAKKFVGSRRVEIALKDDAQGVYVLAELVSKRWKASALIEGSHNHIVRVEANDKILYEDREDARTNAKDLDVLYDLDLENLVNIVKMLPYEEISFLKTGQDMNRRAAGQGLRERAGLGYGVALEDLMIEGLIAEDVVNRGKIEAAAACDARMAGLMVPMMSSFGSGNQAIVINTVLGTMASKEGIAREDLTRSLALSHLVGGLIKCYTGLLGPYCGAAFTAAGAAAIGGVFLLGGELDRMDSAFRFTIAVMGGIFCDGAKESCAMKVAIGTAVAIENVYLSLKGNIAPRDMGIVGGDFKETVENLKLLFGIPGDETILKILGVEGLYI